MRRETALHLGIPALAAFLGLWLALTTGSHPGSLQQAGTTSGTAGEQAPPTAASAPVHGDNPFWSRLVARLQSSLPGNLLARRRARPGFGLPEPDASPTSEWPPRLASLRPGPVQNILKTAEARLILNPGTEDALEIALRNRGRLRKLTETATRIQQLLGECLTRDLCGQTPPDDSPYFDMENTETHRLLNRSLQFLKASADLAPHQVELPADAELLERLKIDNAETQALSLGMLLRDGANASLCSQIIGQSKYVKDTAKLNLFTALNHPPAAGREGQLTGCERDTLISAMSESLKRDDANTVVKVVAGLDRFSLNEQEYTVVVTSLCPFRNDPTLRATSWNEIRMHLGKIHEKNSFGVDPDTLCAPQQSTPSA